MNKLTKELVDDSSFEFLSNYLDVDLRENKYMSKGPSQKLGIATPLRENILPE